MKEFHGRGAGYSAPRPFESPVLSVLIVILIFVAIAVRQVGRLRLGLGVMLAGAILVLLTGRLHPGRHGRPLIGILTCVSGWDVCRGGGLYRSGFLAAHAARLFAGANTTGKLVARIILISGLLSALLMNDTLAIIATPLMLHFSRVTRVDVRLLLLALAFSITTGSVLSPVGNPQNLLVAVQSGMPDAFGTFLTGLAVPPGVSTVLVWLV